MADAQLIHVNGVNGLTGQPLVPPLDAQAASALACKADHAASKHAPESFAVGFGIEPNDLAQAGWGIIYPRPRDAAHRARLSAIREALAPLVDHRRGQASATRSDRFRELWGDEGYRLGQSKARFLDRHGAASAGAVVPDEMPYYLLLIGPPTEIPFDFQYALDVAYAVGRLDLPEPEDFAHYARRVLAAERGEVGRAPGVGMWGPSAGGDRATELSSRYLLPPLADALPDHPVTQRLGADADKASLSRLLRADGPALLMTASHGNFVPRALDPARHRAWAGALITSDWDGPHAPVTGDAQFTAEDLGSDADLAGLISVHFACFGAGVPRRDGLGLYLDTGLSLPPGALPRELSPTPFTAPLPQRMLAHPKGSLAAIGHVDLAFASSFMKPDTLAPHAGQLDPYRSLLDALLSGHRLGAAMEWMHARAAELAFDVAAMVHKAQTNQAPLTPSRTRRLADLWVKTLDARSHVVLGDPAVRLAVRDAGAPPARPAQAEGAGGRDPITDEMPSDVSFGFSERPRREAAPDALSDRLQAHINARLDDLLRFEVRTYSGAGEALDPDGPRQLRAVSRVDLLGETELLVPDGALDPALAELHLAMVQAAQAQRMRLLAQLLPPLKPTPTHEEG